MGYTIEAEIAAERRRATADLSDDELMNELILLNHGNKKLAEKAHSRIMVMRRWARVQNAQ